MDRLRQEVLAHVGPTRRPTFDDIRDMKYLRAVLNGKSSAIDIIQSFTYYPETLRLFPIVPFNVR